MIDNYKIVTIYDTVTKIIDMIISDYELRLPENRVVDWKNGYRISEKGIPKYSDIRGLFSNWKYDLDKTDRSLELIENYINHVYYRVYYGRMDYFDIKVQDEESYLIEDWEGLV